MGKARCRQTQQPVEIELPRGGGQQVGAAHHFGHAHPGIVHHHRQLIGKHPIGTAEVEIAAVPQQVLPVLAHTAIHKDDLFVGHPEPVSRCFLLPLFGNFGGRQIPAGAGIDHVSVRSMGCAGSMELGAGAETGIDQPLRLQLGVLFLIDAAAFALVIGRVRPAGAAALLPDKAEPAQILFQLVGILAGAAFGIQILDPEDDLPSLLLRAQPCQQAAGKVAEMEPPAGAGRKPPDHAAHRLSFHSPSFGWKMGVL